MREVFDPNFDVFEENFLDNRLHDQLFSQAVPEQANPIDSATLQSRAFAYIHNEIEYIQNLHGMVRLQMHRQDPDIPQRFATFDDGTYFYCIASNMDLQKAMHTLKVAYNFVIGGPEGKFKAMSMHSYDPDLHWIMPDDHMLPPTPGKKVMALNSEIGIMKENQYEQLINAAFAVPDYDFPGIEWGVLAELMYRIQSTPIKISQT